MAHKYYFVIYLQMKVTPSSNGCSVRKTITLTYENSVCTTICIDGLTVIVRE